MAIKKSDQSKRLNHKFQVAGIFFCLAGLGLIAVSSIDYLLIFIGVGLIAVGIYYFMDKMTW